MLEPPTLPAIPPETPAGLRAELEVVSDEMLNDYPEARALPTSYGVPTAVVVATPPGRMRGVGDALTRLQIARQSEWALTSPNGMFVTAGHVGHGVHHDDPSLVVNLIQHVVEQVGPGAAAP